MAAAKKLVATRKKIMADRNNWPKKLVVSRKKLMAGKKLVSKK